MGNLSGHCNPDAFAWCNATFRTNGRDDTSKSAKAVNTVKRRPPEYLDAVRRTRAEATEGGVCSAGDVVKRTRVHIPKSTSINHFNRGKSMPSYPSPDWAMLALLGKTKTH